ncbi:phage baseplate assembly protein V [Parafilimonas sp.]|uniref:phage baseplate assembly protein V n=1 Tax=Parafilimonas sp. TaxID=1969739 RepID=UPI003F7E561E
MEKVIADIEIEDQKIEHYSTVTINQKFNEHHTFSIRIKYDVLEKTGSFSLSNAQKLIGKSAVIKLLYANTLEIAYEFHGLVCGIDIEQADNFSSDLVIKGYSPTILLENGQNFNSFYNKKLQQVVDALTGSLSQVNCSVNNSPQYKTPIPYVSQYRESAFHFLNRLSSQFGEWFYYDGQKLYFGKPSGSPNIEIIYGIDVRSMQMKLQILPLTFSGYSYLSKDDKLITADAPSTIDGLDEYASFVLNESNKIFSEPVSLPVKQRIESKSDLDSFLKQKKTAMAANLEVLNATSDNPGVCIGAVADLKVSVLSGADFKKEDGGKFLITAIEHHVSGNGKYYNSFEGIPSGIDVIPVDNVIVPLAEPQIATVKDNKDPDNMGRVRVQMLWQQAGNEMTDWLRVMTPDAGGGKGGAKNRGLVVVPEPGDQVLVCFRYNDPDRPFVLGSMFHGKTGGGGGQGNKVKSLTALSGSIVSLDGDAINIIDAAGNKVTLDGGGKINVNCTSNITLECGSSKITMDSGGKIEISGTEITVSGSTKAEMKSTASFKAEGTAATVKGATAEVNGDSKVDVKSGAAVEVASPATTVKGDANLKLQSATVDVEGSAMTNVKGGVVNLN